jgi:DNA-binding NtrC family response regulator
MRRTVMGLRDLEWVGVLARGTLAQRGARQFVVRQLRDYHAQPVDPARLCLAIGHAWGLAELRQAEKHVRDSGKGERFGLVGNSPPMRALCAAIDRFAGTDLPVLITGETGTGKELVARAIHAQSRRAAKPFVAVNCAAIPASLVQSELFGNTRGAFTGASTSNAGLIRTAEGGVLLLDEIGEMTLEAQASLLRFLEDKNVTPVGGRQSVTVDVTVIASTNRDLHEQVDRGLFRQDLLYRLDMLSIKTPALRDRPSDISALAEHFLEAAAGALPHRIQGLTDDALDWLRAQPWPGNIRELRNCVIQAGLRCSQNLITADDLTELRPMSVTPEQPSLNEVVKGTEKATLEQRLKRNRGNVSKTARELKISPD